MHSRCGVTESKSKMKARVAGCAATYHPVDFNRGSGCVKIPEPLKLVPRKPTSLDSLLVGPSRSEYRTSFPPRNRRSRYSSRKTAESVSWP